MTVKRGVGLRVRVAIVLAVVVALLAGGWLWVRESSLVAVRRVSIVGVYGPDAGHIRSALRLAALNMTTLDVRQAQLQSAVAPYPIVKHVGVSTQFPHGMRIDVVEQLPLGALVAGKQAVVVSGDGTLLRDVAPGSLPSIPVPSLPGGSKVTNGSALDALALLVAAPAQFETRIAQVTTSSANGLVAELRSGPSLYFGDDTDLAAKWASATEVLADPSSAGASYVDVSDPARPAAGVSEQAVAAAGLATTGSSDASGADGASGAGGVATGSAGATASSDGSTSP
ncbi:MAG TPA: FtsQ-type POTRA domain-containing protein [Solirubrobacteraceae bacterium]|nr:FtsQ-type POTRA domain-containing protein [Solirubrobacteraceae bacterium]